MAEEKSTTNVILDAPETWYEWISAIEGTVPEDLWEYFDPDEEVVYEKPSPLTFADVRQGATALADLTASEKAVYAQLKMAYKDDLAQYQRYLKEQARLRTEIRKTVSETKRGLLEQGLATWEWIQALQTSTKPTESEMEDLISSRHRVFTGVKYTDWPSGGPDKWLSEWQKLMQDCKRWCPANRQRWMSDFTLVWSDVPDASTVCNSITVARNAGKQAEWTVERAAKELHQAWQVRKQKSGLKIAHRSKITKTTFMTEPRFDGKTADGSSSPEQAPEKEKDKSSSRARKRAGTESKQTASNKKHKDCGCWACGGRHAPSTCVLLTEKNPKGHKVFEENQKRFDENMKDGAFRRDVEKFRSAIQSTEEIRGRRKSRD